MKRYTVEFYEPTFMTLQKVFKNCTKGEVERLQKYAEDRGEVSKVTEEKEEIS